jgi:hypothetical protein
MVLQPLPSPPLGDLRTYVQYPNRPTSKYHLVCKVKVISLTPPRPPNGEDGPLPFREKITKKKNNNKGN